MRYINRLFTYLLTYLQLSGNQAAVDCVRCVAVHGGPCAQSGHKPKRHQSAREISHETAILSLFKCAQDNSP